MKKLKFKKYLSHNKFLYLRIFLKEANEIKRKIYTGTPDEEQYRKKIK